MFELKEENSRNFQLKEETSREFQEIDTLTPPPLFPFKLHEFSVQHGKEEGEEHKIWTFEDPQDCSVFPHSLHVSSLIRASSSSAGTES